MRKIIVSVSMVVRSTWKHVKCLEQGLTRTKREMTRQYYTEATHWQPAPREACGQISFCRHGTWKRRRPWVTSDRMCALHPASAPAGAPTASRTPASVLLAYAPSARVCSRICGWWIHNKWSPQAWPPFSTKASQLVTIVDTSVPHSPKFFECMTTL